MRVWNNFIWETTELTAFISVNYTAYVSLVADSSFRTLDDIPNLYAIDKTIKLIHQNPSDVVRFRNGEMAAFLQSGLSALIPKDNRLTFTILVAGTGALALFLEYYYRDRLSGG